MRRSGVDRNRDARCIDTPGNDMVLLGGASEGMMPHDVGTLRVDAGPAPAAAAA